MAYEKTQWINDITPLNAENMNKIEDELEKLDNSKVDKEEGKGLSTNDFTDSDLLKLNNIEAGAQVNVQSDWNETDPNSDAYIKNKPADLGKVYDVRVNNISVVTNKIANINLKTINGENISGSGNIATVAYQTFNEDWDTTHTTEAFCNSLVNDSSVVAGMAYLGTLQCTDLPGGLIQGEATVEIISEGSNGKCINIELTSLDTSPYRWSYSRGKINGSYTTQGWLGYQKSIDSSHKLSADLIQDGSNNKVFTASEQSKLAGIESGAEVNVQANWNESDSSSDSFIQNKPTIPTHVTDLVDADDYATKEFVNSSIATNTANFIGTFENIETLLNINILEADSILKAGSLIKADSYINSQTIDEDETLEEDLTITSESTLASGSIIKLGSTLYIDSWINHIHYLSSTTTTDDITIEIWTNNDYAFVINSEHDFATTTEMNAYPKYLLTNFDYGWVVNGTKYDLYRFDVVNQIWNLRVSNTDKSAVTLNTAYNRYKYNSEDIVWEYEYTLNNSSFTAAQWAAINSGANTTNIGQIATNTTAIAGKQNTIDSSHKLSSDLIDDTSSTNKFVTSTDKTTWNNKSVVSVSDTGTSADEVKYITINGTEKKLSGGTKVSFVDWS